TYPEVGATTVNRTRLGTSCPTTRERRVYSASVTNNAIAITLATASEVQVHSDSGCAREMPPSQLPRLLSTTSLRNKGFFMVMRSPPPVASADATPARCVLHASQGPGPRWRSFPAGAR